MSSRETESGFSSQQVNLEEANRRIRRAALLTLMALAITAPLACWLLPQVISLPETLAERMAFAVRASVFVLLCVVIAIFMVSTGRRRSPEDIGGAAAGPPSARLAIPVAFLQNTLEQAVIAVGMYLALASLATGALLALIPLAVAFFLLGRVLFYRGYARGVEGRAPGVALTMLPTVLGYLLVLVLLAGRWLS